ncbi:MAG: hypothetical protein BGO89_13515 [Candidatus Kapaibacterium thiocyanatum]|uniref:Uncharacterized protein n=1 Tax=Candidatus Kapaibacterium thiocyanatum TaxID=1895771 RepID=A0A1M3KVU8_9BACT|nr:MAG: hypothetical protein BGO89_13515 ['Candidatus Kapabacteria' thiocyanatum]
MGMPPDAVRDVIDGDRAGIAGATYVNWIRNGEGPLSHDRVMQSSFDGRPVNAESSTSDYPQRSFILSFPRNDLLFPLSDCRDDGSESRGGSELEVALKNTNYHLGT